MATTDMLPETGTTPALTLEQFDAALQKEADHFIFRTTEISNIMQKNMKELMDQADHLPPHLVAASVQNILTKIATELQKI